MLLDRGIERCRKVREHLLVARLRDQGGERRRLFLALLGHNYRPILPFLTGADPLDNVRSHPHLQRAGLLKQADLMRRQRLSIILQPQLRTTAARKLGAMGLGTIGVKAIGLKAA